MFRQPASAGDLLIVYVKNPDKKGTLCVDDSSNVTLSVEKGGSVTGPHEMNPEAGIASFLVKTGEEDELVLNARTSFANRNYKLKLVH